MLRSEWSPQELLPVLKRECPGSLSTQTLANLICMASAAVDNRQFLADEAWRVACCLMFGGKEDTEALTMFLGSRTEVHIAHFTLYALDCEDYHTHLDDVPQLRSEAQDTLRIWAKKVPKDIKARLKGRGTIHLHQGDHQPHDLPYAIVSGLRAAGAKNFKWQTIFNIAHQLTDAREPLFDQHDARVVACKDSFTMDACAHVLNCFNIKYGVLFEEGPNKFVPPKAARGALKAFKVCSVSSPQGVPSDLCEEISRGDDGRWVVR